LRKPRQAGFTVLEVLIALAVIGVAVSVFISLYRLSLTFLENSRGERIVAHVAEEQLALIVARPDALEWDSFWEAAPGERHRLSTFKKAEPPLAMPTERGPFSQTKRLYEDCDWEAYARLPDADAAYVEVSVEVHWKLDGRSRLFVLTSCVPRSRIKAAA
jgi:prepilin-type N-terminal cleavage/methylation domain-containing protein